MVLYSNINIIYLLFINQIFITNKSLFLLLRWPERKYRIRYITYWKSV